ncbi:phosphate signaling complex protein PhoU [Alteribacter populi]|uniref:phosphate signaling complex protein PhoU n=1 Tax=Alteribacter populi TaxID=2011011 RepID=UPI000BBB611F|nr:phosphate signaling complex protein PhoU [Alteribacter populi]
MVRGTFEIELEDLKKEMVGLGKMVESSLSKIMTAIKENDNQKMDDIIVADKNLNEIELEINEKATLMIAKQQPVASDLRRIIVSLKISSDLERMGDLAVDMAKSAKRMKPTDTMIAYEEELVDLASKAQHMLTDVLKAYKELNVLDAQQIATKDDEVDHAYGRFVSNLFNCAVSKKEDIQQITQMAFIARYIERIADYCTNIAEWIIYEVNGQRFDLN